MPSTLRTKHQHKTLSSNLYHQLRLFFRVLDLCLIGHWSPLTQMTLNMFKTDLIITFSPHLQLCFYRGFLVSVNDSTIFPAVRIRNLRFTSLLHYHITHTHTHTHTHPIPSINILKFNLLSPSLIGHVIYVIFHLS